MNCSECPYVKDGVCIVEKDTDCPIKVNLPLTKTELIPLDRYLNCWASKGLILKIHHLMEKCIRETGSP
jgi:hypothetical protein